MHLFLGGLDCCVAHGHTDKDFNYCVRGFGGRGTRMWGGGHVLWKSVKKIFSSCNC